MKNITHNEIRALIREILEKNNDTNHIGDDDALISSGRLDSLDIAELMIYLQDEYGINTANSDPDFYNKLDSIESITQYINQHN
ncbi:acyl carrier protein [Marinomonas polaris]|uniref:acyl carrier protein n=1 Tax=Marinomonas TaxID=28253 RepID=UPI000C28EB07|nr:acyl carrier protein [Marinomonas sp. ef1]